MNQLAEPFPICWPARPELVHSPAVPPQILYGASTGPVTGPNLPVSTRRTAVGPDAPEDPVHEPQITLTGNLAWPPRLRTVPGGTSVADFRVACTQRRRDPQGEWKDGETLWFGVTCWRQLAENAAASLKKGDRVVVAGRLAQRTWTGEDGVEHVNLEIEASSVGVDLNRYTVTVDRPVRIGAAEQTWASTGYVNTDTGEVVMQPTGDAGPLVPLDDGEEIAA